MKPKPIQYSIDGMTDYACSGIQEVIVVHEVQSQNVYDTPFARLACKVARSVHVSQYKFYRNEDLSGYPETVDWLERGNDEYVLISLAITTLRSNTITLATVCLHY